MASRPGRSSLSDSQSLSYFGIEILEVYSGTKFNDTCISELRFPNKTIGKTENLYFADDATILIQARFRKSELSKIRSFWVENSDGKRSGWISTDSSPISEIENVEASFQNSFDCGPDCEEPSDFEYSYTLGVPLKKGLKFSVSAKNATSLHIVTDYFGKGALQKNYDIIPAFDSSVTEVFHLTDLPKTK